LVVVEIKVQMVVHPFLGQFLLMVVDLGGALLVMVLQVVLVGEGNYLELVQQETHQHHILHRREILGEMVQVEELVQVVVAVLPQEQTVQMPLDLMAVLEVLDHKF
jgi:hypothetical protein